MAILRIWAGDDTPLTELPSPVSVKRSDEIIWSEKTGRAQSGENKAKMIGSVVDTKHAYEIKWGILTSDEMSSIRSLLHSGFFLFDVGATASTSPHKYYRSEISGELFQAGSRYYYKDATVSVIEQ